jgi:hypothetical protein
MATTRTYSLRWAARWADPSGFEESCAKVPGPPDPSCMREPDPLRQRKARLTVSRWGIRNRLNIGRHRAARQAES